MKRNRNHESSSHPTHPVRNFFYVLWSLLNVLAFVVGFFLLAVEKTFFTTVVLVLCAGIVGIALVFGVIRPLFRGR